MQTQGHAPGPSKRGYGLGLALLLVGGVVTIVQVLGISRRVAALHRAQMPATVAVTLAAGDNEFYGEAASLVDRDTVRVGAAPTFECSVTGPTAVTVARPRVQTSYHLGKYRGESVFSATAGAAGAYQVTCTGDPFVLVWGANLGTAIFAAAAGAGIPLLLSFLFLTVTWVRRRRARRAASARAA